MKMEKAIPCQMLVFIFVQYPIKSNHHQTQAKTKSSFDAHTQSQSSA